MHHSTINLSLSHPAKRQFQSSVSSAPYVVRAKSHHFLRPLSILPPLPHTPLCRFTHPLPLVNLFSAPILIPLDPAGPPFSLPHIPR